MAIELKKKFTKFVKISKLKTSRRISDHIVRCRRRRRVDDWGTPDASIHTRCRTFDRRSRRSAVGRPGMTDRGTATGRWRRRLGSVRRTTEDTRHRRTSRYLRAKSLTRSWCWWWRWWL